MRAVIFNKNPIARIACIFFMLSACCGSAAAADSRPAELIAQGDAADKKDEALAALALFLEAEKIDPNNPALLARISEQYSALVDISKPAAAEKAARACLAYARRSVAAGPDNAKAHLALAIGYGRMTDYTDNKTKLEYSKIIRSETEKSIALDPTDDFPYYVLGRWHYGFATLNPILRFFAKLVYGTMPHTTLEDAEKYLEKASALAPQRIIHHLELAHTYEAMKKYGLAEKEWKTVLALQATDREDREAQEEARKALKH